MGYWLAFVVGFSLGVWCNGPNAHERGQRWGKWTREHILRLPPVASQHNNTGGE